MFRTTNDCASLYTTLAKSKSRTNILTGAPAQTENTKPCDQFGYFASVLLRVTADTIPATTTRTGPSSSRLEGQIKAQLKLT